MLGHNLAKLSVYGCWYGSRDSQDQGLRWTGRGRVKDFARPKDAAGRVIRLIGSSNRSEFRVHRAGIAVLSAMFSREFFEDARGANREGTHPTVADPANAPH